MKTFVIGLGGVTNGGKTTLARRLKKLFPNCSIISQDDFFKPESEVAIDDRGFLQYDVLDALQMEKMVASVCSWMTNSGESASTRLPNSTDGNQKGAEDIHVLIVEGFLLYNYRPLSNVWDKKYFLTIPYEECKRRRSSRIYNPPDPPGYFDGHVWPMYLKHKREMEENEADIVYLDGTESQDDLCTRIYNDIVQEWKKTMKVADCVSGRLDALALPGGPYTCLYICRDGMIQLVPYVGKGRIKVTEALSPLEGNLFS